MQRLVFGFALSILLICATRSQADDSPKYAERGMAAYAAGKYDLARLFFNKALQDAVLKGKEDWIAKATINLADVELEAMDYGEAGRLLEGLSTRDNSLRSLIIWKRSQLAYQERKFPQALLLVDSSLQLAKGENDKERVMQLDRLRYLIQSRDPSEWSQEFEAFAKHLGRLDQGRTSGLQAMAAMARKEFSVAEPFWQQAIIYYRDQGRLAKVAACLNQQAICLFSLGQREAAQESNSRAVAIYGELGLNIPGLRAQALRLLLIEDPRELAKLRQDMDLLGQRFNGFDLQAILDEYSHSLHYGRIGAGP